jgi:hypothetical protein
MNHRPRTTRATRPQHALLPALIAAAFALPGAPAQAFSFDTGNPDFKLRWDNTFKYSAAFRLKERSETIMEDHRTDDGDRNFSKGLISNRVDVLSEMDASFQNFGARLSGAAWYDRVYNKPNDSNAAIDSNVTSVPYNEFAEETRNRMGRKAELLDAFAYAKGSIGGMAGTVRLGRHSLVFGETLFFGANGIANAQGPIDLVKLLNVPSSQFKEVLRPVNQVSGQLQLTSDLSMSAYYQLKWEKSIIPPAGSYLSTSDIAGEGAESVRNLSAIGLGVIYPRGADIKPRDSGQGGVQLRYRMESIDSELGLYAARYHDKSPQLYLATDIPGGFAPVNLVHVYPEGIRTYGASLSTIVGPVNGAGEVSIRTNAPLVSDPVVVQYNGGFDNRDNPAYAIGKTGHAQLSAVYLMQTGALWQGGVVLGEIAWNRTISVNRNFAALDPNTTRDAYAFRVLFSPAYYQVLPGLDINIPLGLGYNPKGRSSAVFGFNGGVEHGGDVSIGLTGTYENVWNFGINYVKYLGKESPFLTPPNSNFATLSYGQALKDRDFVSLNVKRSF